MATTTGSVTRPAPAPDGDRTWALIGSSLGLGVLGGGFGLLYLGELVRDEKTGCSPNGAPPDVSLCGHPHAQGPLVAYGAIVGIVPSLPRFVVGDTMLGLIFTGARAASIATAALVPWGHDDDTRWQGPFLLGFAAPVALAIVDLATTPYREEVEATTAKARIPALAPVALSDAHHGMHGALLTIAGVF